MTASALSAQSSTSVTPIILWCVPRSVSTATERAFMTRPDTRVWHEPLGDPFYFSSGRQCLRYTEEEAKKSGHWDKNIVDVLQSLLDPEVANEGSDKDAKVEYIFIKDMAQYIMPENTLRNIHPGSRVYQTSGEAGVTAHGIIPDGEVLENPTVIPTELMRRFKHTFLVRTPQKAVPSYWKCVQEKAAGFEYFDGAEAGFEELRLLYKWISNPSSTFNTAVEETSNSFKGTVQKQTQPPALVDASVLLAHPHETIKHLCDATGVPFDPAMLSWESGPQAEFQKWGTYHKGAENSTGFKAETPITRQARQAARRAEQTKAAATTGASSQSEVEARKEDKFPKEVQDTITRNMEPYNWLYARRTIKGVERGSV